MSKVAEDTRTNPTDGSALAMHIGDAGSDACDRDFAVCLLFQEQNALMEIEHALRRIEPGSYGICEMSGEPIPISRLEAVPFARFTVECQAEISEAKHDENAWATRSPIPFQFLFVKLPTFGELANSID